MTREIRFDNFEDARQRCLDKQHEFLRSKKELVLEMMSYQNLVMNFKQQ